MADLTTRIVSFVEASTPQELRRLLFEQNLRSGKMTEVINIIKDKNKWYAFFYARIADLPKMPNVKTNNLNEAEK